MTQMNRLNPAGVGDDGVARAREGSPAGSLDRALARAVMARFLRSRLGEPATAADLAWVLREARAPVEAAARVLEGAEPSGLALALTAFFETGAPEDPASAHERLFGHTLRGRVCPYECEYGPRALIQQAHELADLTGFYEAFGLKPATQSPERPDHVACELEFLEFLSRKEAYAVDAGEREMYEVTHAAMRRFLGEHLGRFGRAFAVSLREADPEGHYGRLGAVAEAFLRTECEALEVEIGPRVLELRSTEEEEVPMACGTGDDLIQLGAPVDLGE